MRAGVAVWIEIVFLGVVLSVAVALLSRSVASRRRRNASSGHASRAAAAGTPTGVGPVAAAFPIERTEHERRVGDAAFVDGLIVGRYFLPRQPGQAEDQPASREVEDREASADGDDDATPGPDADRAMGTGAASSGVYEAPTHELNALETDLESDPDDGYTAGWGGVHESLEEEDSEDAFDDDFDDGFDDVGDW